MNISNNVASMGIMLNDFNKSADAVANIAKTDNTQSKTDLSREIPNQMIAQNGLEANTTSIKTADEMFGSLLDVIA